MELTLRPPSIWFMVVCFPLTWIAEKLNALPDNIRLFHNGLDYWLMLVILVLLASFPVIKFFRE